MKNYDIEFNPGIFGWAGIITFLFVVLKIFGVINWSIWWVISPIFFAIGWICFLIFCLGLLSLFLLAQESGKKPKDDNAKEEEKAE